MALMDEYLGDMKEYQKAVDEGFQGTYEEFLRYKASGSFANGGKVKELNKSFLRRGTRS